MRRTPAAVVLFFAAWSLPPYASPVSWRVGTYELSSESSRQGVLTLQAVSGRKATFSLDVTVCNSPCDENSAFNRHGTVKNESISLAGPNGTYASANAEDNQLGHCILRFSSSAKAIVVKQSGSCWWFGAGVDVSGTYKARTRKAP